MDLDFFGKESDAQVRKEEHEKNGRFAFISPRVRCGVTVYYVKSFQRENHQQQKEGVANEIV